MSSQMDPQLAAILQHAPPYPGARAIPLEELRAYIRQTAVDAPRYPAPLAEVGDIRILGPVSGQLTLRHYRPVGQGPWPVTLFFHGGGFVMGDLNSQDMICRALAAAAETIVLSVDYRLAPEHPYPAAAEDAFTALRWAQENAALIGGDASRLAVAGDSAGGVLAAVTAVRARRAGIPLKAQVLFYGAGGYPFDKTPSWAEFKNGALLNADDIDYFWELYLGDVEARGREPDAGPRYADLTGVAPAYALSAELDPTRDDCEDFADRIRAAGGEAVTDRAPGMIHGFLSFLGAVDEAERAIERTAAWLKQRWV
ncbi:MAG: alpha/beta hydrolase [Candidatus Brevundimonas phytovorans]|nr:alpha/beta hydrolase [Brevundimonas sp.]WEK56741.1 MAG: alpha/beta hydrolase [Brevundimonas sp.]